MVKRARQSKPELAFELLWNQRLKERDDVIAASFGLEREWQFARHLKRKFRFDFAHIASHVAVEIQGGIYTRGAHVRPAGYRNDCEKSLIARELMWSTVMLTPDMIDTKHVDRVIDLAKSREFVEGPLCDFVICHTSPNGFPSAYCTEEGNRKKW